MGKKTPGQLKREIAEILKSPSSSLTSHSAKALSTLAIMGTEPSQWELTPIEWVEEQREVPGMIQCPTCLGRKFVRISDGQVVPPPSRNSPGSFAYHNEARRDSHMSGRMYGNCPGCGLRKLGWGTIPQGKIEGMVLKNVKVGYPRFPVGTRFDSRFSGGLRCNLCNKLLMRARRVPVHGTGDDGVTHGMLVGEDCARKFLDVKIKRDDDSIMEIGNAHL